MQTVGNRRDDDADEDAGDEGGLVEFVSIGPARADCPADERRRERDHGILVILAITLGLILPRLLFEHFLPAPE